MTDHTPENIQFFLTGSSPCPYLPGREERKLFTHLTPKRAGYLHHLLSDHGFRRSQNLIYRPACEGCNACQSVRVVVEGFSPSKRQARVLRKNSDLVGETVDPIATAEQYDLFKRYLEARHADGGMNQMSAHDYEYMVEDTPVHSVLVEYRLAPEGASNFGRLIGVALTDVLPTGLSMVYSFFEPGMASRGLGNFIVLDHIARARAAGLPYVYLGYWVPGSPKMAYKIDYGPLEVQAGPLGWRPLGV